jgi:TRAP-type uncharacterized transport system substrate-binding protein
LRWAQEAFDRAGFRTTVERRGADAIDLLGRIGRGEADVTVTIDCAGWMAANGKGTYRGRPLPIAAIAVAVHPHHYFFAMVRSDLEIGSFAALAKRKPALSVCVRPAGYVAGAIARDVARRHGIDLDTDIVAWGGRLDLAPPDPGRRLAHGEIDAIILESTPRGYPLFAAMGRPMTVLPIEGDAAAAVSAEYGVPVAQIPVRSVPGQDTPVATLGATNYVIAVHKDLANDLAHDLAMALNESSLSDYPTEDIFYSLRHAGETISELHPGAARYYRETRR